LAEIIVVTSGKGGVGKTTTSASFACGLARQGKKTAVIDFDVGLRNLDLIMGCERRVVYDFVNVDPRRGQPQAGADQGQALRQPVRAGRLADARQGRADQGRREKVLKDLADDGLRLHRLRLARRHREGRVPGDVLRRPALVVVNPEVSSVRDSDRILGMLASKTRKAENGERVKEHLLLTRYSPEPRRKGRDAVDRPTSRTSCGLKVIGVIPESGCRSSWRTSAAAAAHSPNYLPDLQRELVAVISKYVSINPDIKDIMCSKVELPDAELSA
jgi:septum site-determining protein MinD